MKIMEPNQALQANIAISTALIPLIQVVVIIGVVVTGPA
jgi:hypothetical protein